MRHDLFYGRKSVHVKLTKEQHAALREKLFRYGLTMQDLFQDATEMVLLEGDRSDRLLQKVAKKKMLQTLEKTNRRHDIHIGEFDTDTLYNLLEADARKDEE